MLGVPIGAYEVQVAWWESPALLWTGGSLARAKEVARERSRTTHIGQFVWVCGKDTIAKYLDGKEVALARGSKGRESTWRAQIDRHDGAGWTTAGVGVDREACEFDSEEEGE